MKRYPFRFQVKINGRTYAGFDTLDYATGWAQGRKDAEPSNNVEVEDMSSVLRTRYSVAASDSIVCEAEYGPIILGFTGGSE